MYSVKVRNSIMIAHSLPHDFFGPAQNMHGATYVVDVTFYAENLDPHNVVIDIGKAKDITKEVLSHLNYKNLDELPQFKNKLTTTEFIAKYIHDKIKEEVSAFFEGRISVYLGETHDAWGSYSG
ncbi:6-pyruvoyl trahydropterin synthase family protein [Pontimicrobium sp. IMCC45349]|uniref:6-pyruvoyl trahydropterin synthase family protein n=1 Tax=Pontimicrobium sp. IMCC45349 TaxID=3391574 RepID=UPI0039A39031